MTDKKSANSKVIQRMNKRSAKSGRKDVEGEFKKLRNQYDIIRDDVVKLRDDLQKGYDMARGMVERKSLLKDFLKGK